MKQKPKYKSIELAPLPNPDLEREYTMEEALVRLKELTKSQNNQISKTTQP